MFFFVQVGSGPSFFSVVIILLFKTHVRAQSYFCALEEVEEARRHQSAESEIAKALRQHSFEYQAARAKHTDPKACKRHAGACRGMQGPLRL